MFEQIMVWLELAYNISVIIILSTVAYLFIKFIQFMRFVDRMDKVRNNQKEIVNGTETST